MQTKLLFFLSILLANHVFCQTKDEFIQAIITNNSVDGITWDSQKIDDELNGSTNKQGKVSKDNYYNFEKLKKLLSPQELVALTNHASPVIRVYAIKELIHQHNPDINIVQILKKEINLKEVVNTNEGCISSMDLVYSEIYHDYWNRVRWDAAKEQINNQDSITQIALSNNVILNQIDSLIIFSDEDIYWLLYERALSNRKYSEKYLERIMEMFYQSNNSFALAYLTKYYPEKKDTIFEYYFENIFPTQKFDNDNQVVYQFNITQYVLANKMEKYTNLVIEKLKNTHKWKEHSGWFKYQIINKYHLDIK